MSTGTGIIIGVVGLGVVGVLGLFVYGQLKIQAEREKSKGIGDLLSTGLTALPGLIALF